MLKLVDIEYYKNVYHGEDIPSDSFESICLDASAKINAFTFDRINEQNIDDEIRNTACDIISLLYDQKKPTFKNLC